MIPKPLNKPGTDLEKALQALEETLETSPELWDVRKRVAQIQYDQGKFFDAANTIWSAPEIPPVDIEIAFSVRTLAKGKPRRALRLVHAVLEQNQGKPVKNLAIGNALLHHGMVILAARFYGAACAEQPGLMDPEYEYWLMWVDDSQKLWGEWSDNDIKLEELPWIRRDEKLISELDQQADFKLTTPIRIPSLPESPAEALDEIGHVHHSPKEGSRPLAPPSIQFTPEAVASLDGGSNIPGQRQEGDAFPASSAPLPSAPAAQQATPPSSDEAPASVPQPSAAPVSEELLPGDSSEPEALGAPVVKPAPAPAIPSTTSGAKLILPGGQQVSTRKLNPGGPASPQAPSITLPDENEDS